MRPLHIAALVLLLSLAAHAQTVTPDCAFTSVFTSATPGGSQINKGTATGGNPCLYWEFMYWTNGASSVSVKMEGAKDVAGVADTSYTALTAAQGTANPQTGANQGAAALCCDYYPWVRINPTTFSGTNQTMTVRAYGWKTQPVPAGGSAVTSNVNIAQWSGSTALSGGVAGSAGVGGLAAIGAAPSGNPIPQGLRDSAGNIIIPDYCTSKATFSTTTSGSVQLVAVSAATTIRVCHVDWTGDTQTIAKLVTGTGATCTSSADETGTITGAGGGMFGFAMDYASPLLTTAAKTLCLNLSAASTGGGTIIYSQR